jgi:hypothetical protein
MLNFNGTLSRKSVKTIFNNLNEIKNIDFFRPRFLRLPKMIYQIFITLEYKNDFHNFGIRKSAVAFAL